MKYFYYGIVLVLLVYSVLFQVKEWFALMATALTAFIIFIESKKVSVKKEDVAKLPEQIKVLNDRLNTLENLIGFKKTFK